MVQRRVWIDPKLVVFGDVNQLTQVAKYVNPGDGVLFGISVGPTPAYPGQPPSGHISL